MATYLMENGVYVQANSNKEMQEIAERWAIKLDVKVLMWKNIEERKWHPAYYRQGERDFYGKEYATPPFNYYS